MIWTGQGQQRLLSGSILIMQFYVLMMGPISTCEAHVLRSTENHPMKRDVADDPSQASSHLQFPSFKITNIIHRRSPLKGRVRSPCESSERVISIGNGRTSCRPKHDCNGPNCPN
ncbi:uncharacterized protein PGTG_18187 [Puccinia graminis f. sp. tritici CRL 75-36-700-3]|uniref:Uncharacterized protein n=1 Tax=Puccinia graminis f. sp. tritici (strain CRL 75-36-700-3 / race SCCL) TaxID=418459 RepID=E3L7Z7_PUCGT|nr:uncharacterized protein PGTG_18187 [Puccinia graminis f. sp. tritici CRL 75-36-700-3]EFP92672.1 hypothetical protein PGTG_18187 [Puccinia graminis f. sp. tritici CRL 75-36-700-3]